MPLNASVALSHCLLLPLCDLITEVSFRLTQTVCFVSNAISNFLRSQASARWNIFTPLPFFSRYISHEGAYVQVQQPDPGKQGLFQCQRRWRAGEPFGEVSWGWGMGVDWGGEERGSACAQLRFVHEVASLTVHKGLSALRPSGGGC